jgi:hypothetical protein
MSPSGSFFYVESDHVEHQLVPCLLFFTIILTTLRNLLGPSKNLQIFSDEED